MIATTAMLLTLGFFGKIDNLYLLRSTCWVHETFDMKPTGILARCQYRCGVPTGPLLDIDIWRIIGWRTPDPTH